MTNQSHIVSMTKTWRGEGDKVRNENGTEEGKSSGVDNVIDR